MSTGCREQEKGRPAARGRRPSAAAAGQGARTCALVAEQHALGAAHAVQHPGGVRARQEVFLLHAAHLQWVCGVRGAGVVWACSGWRGGDVAAGQDRAGQGRWATGCSGSGSGLLPRPVPPAPGTGPGPAERSAAAGHTHGSVHAAAVHARALPQGQPRTVPVASSTDCVVVLRGQPCASRAISEGSMRPSSPERVSPRTSSGCSGERMTPGGCLDDSSCGGAGCGGAR
jgi:hypothetical protein